MPLIKLNSTCPSRFLWVQDLIENGGQSYPFGPGSRHRLIKHHQHGLKGHQSRISPEIRPGYTPSTSRPRVQPMGQRRRSVGLVGGRPTYRPADLDMGPTTSNLRCGSSSLDGEVGSRGSLLNSRPRRGWLPLFILGEGLHFKHHQASSYQVTLSRCSSSSLVEVLGLEEFGFES